MGWSLLGLGEVSGNEVLGMLDWLLERQPWIERSLANRRLAGEALILYDLSSSHVARRRTALTAFGHNRDMRQVTYGLLCDRAGCPIAIEAFEGNAADPATVSRQIDKIRRRFGLGRVALVGDWGMAANARIRDVLDQTGLDWISALNITDLRKLMKTPLTADVSVPDAVAEITSPDFPGERLVVCFNLQPRDKRRRMRDEPQKVAEDWPGEIAWVVRTSLDAGSLGTDEAVEACKCLVLVEQAFRQIKTGQLTAGPVFVRSEAHACAHIFLCMLAYYAEWHMRKRLAPILFDEDEPEAAHNFHTLITDLSTVALNDVSLGSSGSFLVVTSPTPGQQRAFDLLGVDPTKTLPTADK